MTKETIITYLDTLYPNAHCELNYKNNYELLIAVILSAQTTDKKVNQVTPILFWQYPNFMALKEADIENVISIIKPLGLASSKGKNIILTAKKIVDEYHNEIPTTKEELLSLPGVGKKVAEVYMGDALGANVFPVDTHVNRVANRLEITDSPNPNIISKDLNNFFEGENLMKLHHQFIFFGRYFCKAINPNCDNCLLKCKYSKSKTS